MIYTFFSDSSRNREFSLSKYPDNEGVLQADDINAKHLRSDLLTARKVSADRILSDTVVAKTLIVSKQGRTFKHRDKPERKDATRPFDNRKTSIKNTLEQTQYFSDKRGKNVNVLGISRTNLRSLGKLPRIHSSQLHSRSRTAIENQQRRSTKRRGLRGDKAFQRVNRHKTRSSSSSKGTRELLNNDIQISKSDSNQNGLLNARKILSKTIDTMSLTADHVLADRIRSDKIKTTNLRVTDKRKSKVSYYHYDVETPDVTRTNLPVTNKSPTPYSGGDHHSFNRKSKKSGHFHNNDFVHRKVSRGYSKTSTDSRRKILNIQRPRQSSTDKYFESTKVRIKPKNMQNSFEVEYLAPYAVTKPNMAMFIESPTTIRRLSTPDTSNRHYQEYLGYGELNFDPVLPTVDHLQYINDKYRSYRKITDRLQFF